tara:strand:+ start:96 stop:539 length:444 start_codon:yes stop_codon:yes gene_type:complete
MKVKDCKIYSNEINRLVDVQEMLQEIVNVAADFMKNDASMKFVSCSNSDGPTHAYPTIRTHTQYKTDDVCQALLDIGVPAEIDLYEDDDGDDEYGRSIIRRIWSVQIPTLKIHSDDVNNMISPLNREIQSTNWKWCSDTHKFVNIKK